MMTVYGIPNCDTVKKSIDWLKKNHLDFSFHNYKTAGISKETLTAWMKKTSWENLVNKKSATWRGLPDEEKNVLTDKKSAIKLLISHPTLIRRPVIEYNDELVIGFDEKVYSLDFKHTSPIKK